MLNTSYQRQFYLMIPFPIKRWQPEILTIEKRATKQELMQLLINTVKIRMTITAILTMSISYSIRGMVR